MRNKIIVRILFGVITISVITISTYTYTLANSRNKALESYSVIKSSEKASVVNTKSKQAVTTSSAITSTSLAKENTSTSVVVDKIAEQEQEIEQKQEKLAKLENDIKAYLGNNLNNVGVSYFDLNTGMNMNINGDESFLAGSTVKVQMNMVLYNMFQSGQASDSERLKYTSDCYEEGTGILQGTDLSNPISIMTLSEYSIVHSDNIATNMIIDRLGYANFKDSVDQLLGHATDHSDNYITANDETELLKILYKNPNNNPYYSKLINFMKNTDFHDRMDSTIPQNLVAHKIGDYSTYVNDVGIVYTSQPYILSVYTNNVDDANEVIAHISKMIYDYQNSLQ